LVGNRNELLFTGGRYTRTNVVRSFRTVAGIGVVMLIELDLCSLLL
jgi:hypothetical protein